MKLQVIAKNNVEVSETLEAYVEKKISKLGRYLSTIGEGKVEISREGTKLPEQRFTVQVTLDSRGVLIRAQEKSKDIRTAIDKVVDVLSKRIERYKGKLYDKSRGISFTRQGAAIEAEEIEAPKRVVKTKRFLVKPMPIDEAISQMELLGHDFFLFVDADTERLNLLYRRDDGNYGLIEPEQG
ncbi:MAG: ribosome-associated translation inhibitor RaiA [Dehalococcoidia bacterium]|jgi:putative sigma-54 modulation protein|nr:ribosome-associated translation inhibitor RaiA [Dehalococcoidia bacterium]